MGLRDLTFYDVIVQNSKIYSKKTAWYEVDTKKEYSFSDIKRHVDIVGTFLKDTGIQKGDRVAILSKNCYEYFILYGACGAVGAILLPINWRLSEGEILYNINDCTPKLMFVSAEYEEMVNNIKSKIGSVSNYISTQVSNIGFEPFPNLDRESSFEPDEVKSDDGFVIIHTAAVEGRPRGALLSHENMLLSSMHLCYHCELTNKDVHLNLLPLFHVGGLSMAMSSFHAGALNVNISKFDSELCAQLIQDKKVSFMFDFSPILASIMDKAKEKGFDISSLKKVIGLENKETIQRYQETVKGCFYVMYGQTETSCVATVSRYDERPGSAGRPIPLAQVGVMDDKGRLLEKGEIGEIVMKGPMVFQGYWNLPEDNEKTFKYGWHHTGDLGRFDEDGYLWYEGRKADKELIKPGGENVYPAEVERAILEHPDVEKVVVFGVPDPKWKEGIKAVCKLKEGSKLTGQELIEFVGQRIARYKKPQYVEFVEELPQLPDGSIDRQQVKKLYGGI